MPWGPDGQQAAILLTFDNYGEAFEQQQGRWAADRTPGTHPTAHEIVPALMDELRCLGLKSTYFVEGCNAALYPTQLQAIHADGHEIGVHGWQHETWYRQPMAMRARILRKSVGALREIGITATGFRPPGGIVTADTARWMAELGMHYVSPLADTGGPFGNIGNHPFHWQDVDALYFEPWLAEARQTVFGGEGLRSLSDWEAELNAVIDRALAGNTCTVLVFHPYLLADDDRRRVLGTFLARLAVESRVWTPRMVDFHHWQSASLQVPGQAERTV